MLKRLCFFQKKRTIIQAKPSGDFEDVLPRKSGEGLPGLDLNSG